MRKFNLKSNKGITLIALIITIIVLLILAGVTISAISGNESAMDKAKQAKNDTTIAEAKEAAMIKATEFIQEYMDKRYVQNLDGFATSNPTIGGYVATQLNNKTSGNYTFTTSNLSLTVKDTSNTTIVEGTIDQDTGKITWTETSGGGNGGGQSGTDLSSLPDDSVHKLAINGKIQRWDKINYDPGTATIANIDLPEGADIEKTKLASLNLPSGATILNYTSSDSADDIKDWIILDVNQSTGEVLIMPDLASDNNGYIELQLAGKNGYNNAIETLNTVSELYLNPEYATSARSLKEEDLIEITNHKQDGQEVQFTFNNRYGMNGEMDIIDSGSYENKPSRTYTCINTSEDAESTFYWGLKIECDPFHNFFVALRHIIRLR